MIRSPFRCVLVRCDGSTEIGLGHVVRCLALADELRDGHDCDVRFLVRQATVAVRMIETAGYRVEQPASREEEDIPWISRAVSEIRAGALVLDFRAGLSSDAVREWRRQGVLTVSIDDPEDKRIACDLVFSPPVPQVKRANWSGFTGKLCVGWEWVLLRRQFANVPPRTRKNPHPVVLVTMGGSDPAGLTLKALKALDSLNEDFDTIVIVGGAFCHNDALEKILGKSRRKFEIRRNVADMAALMADADLAVASFSATAYELATVGVPGIYLCLSDDHAEAALAFVEAGIGISLGVHTEVTEPQLADRVKNFLRDSALRSEMGRKSRSLMDGRGAQNVARVIMQTLVKRKLQGTLQAK